MINRHIVEPVPIESLHQTPVPPLPRIQPVTSLPRVQEVIRPAQLPRVQETLHAIDPRLEHVTHTQSQMMQKIINQSEASYQQHNQY